MTKKEADSKKATLKVGRPNTLSLTKTVEGGKVKQNFTHGRSKTVQVEVRKTRNFTRKQGGGMVEVAKDISKSGAPGGLSKAEQEARLKALQQGEKTSLKADYKVPRPQNKPNTQEQNKEVVRPTPAKPDMMMDDVATKNLAAMRSAPPKPDHSTSAPAKKTSKGSDEDGARKTKMRLKDDDGWRKGGKLTVTQALSMDDGEQRSRSLASVKRARAKARKEGTPSSEQEKRVREVIVPEVITVQELSNRMTERTVDVIKALMKLGTMATAQQSIDADTAELLIEEFGHVIKRVSDADVEDVLVKEEDKPEDMKPRPPVVTVMGHVDHGKTSLLDALRATDVATGEAGGITQHIGAYQVEMASGDKITFLDTPGHEAFTAMRARGAKITDVVVLVVAADDGIKPQTIEAISHAKSAEVPIIVAINKIDKPEADPEKVKNELMQHELVPEEYGGDIMVCPVSAKEKTGLTELEEGILLQSEVLELQANPSSAASGIVIESKIDKGRGTVATLLIQRGTLSIGDIVVAGAAYGKVRAIVNDKGSNLAQAIPALPVEILGLGMPPQAGDDFAVVENEKTARDITEYRANRLKELNATATAKSLDQMFAASTAHDIKEFNMVVKGDVHGSIEAIIGSLDKFADEEVKVKIAHSGVGAISESDISLAMATGGVVIGFNVRATPKAREMAERENVEIRYYSVIYDVIDDVKKALSGLLSPELRENIIGYAEIQEVFNITKIGKVAGCKVIEGMVKRGAGVRLLRDNVVIHEGKLKTLKRFKEEVKEVKNGYECGMAFESYDDLKENDQIECYEVQEIARTVEEKKDIKTPKGVVQEVDGESTS